MESSKNPLENSSKENTKNNNLIETKQLCCVLHLDLAVEVKTANKVSALIQVCSFLILQEGKEKRKEIGEYF